MLGYPSIDFVFLWHIKRAYIRAVLRLLILKNLKKWNFDDFFKNCDFWGLSLIIDGSLYGGVLGYPSMDFVFLCQMEQTSIGAVLIVLFLKNLKNWNFGDFFEKR